MALQAAHAHSTGANNNNTGGAGDGRQQRYAGLTPSQYLDGADMEALLATARGAAAGGGVGGGKARSKATKQVNLLCNRPFS